MSESYFINEIFYSLQGEGARAGTPNVFVRFANCNLTCSIEDEHAGFDCDTEFSASMKYTAKDLVGKMNDLFPEGGQRACVLTGGEPSLQLDNALLGELETWGWYVAIETNGTHELPPTLDWICVSPKSAWHTIRVKKCDELKLVRAIGQHLPKEVPIEAGIHLVSPAFTPNGLQRETLKWCKALVLNNPKWRLSVQYHKFLGIR